MNRSQSSTLGSMALRAESRGAMSLLELSAVLLIVGMLGVVAATRYGGSAIADVSGQGFAQRLALDCLQARARTIGTGQSHFLRFTIASGKATQYALYRDQGGTDVLVDTVRTVPADVDVTTAGTVNLAFAFTGEALASYAITVAAPDRTWTVTVPQATGKPFLAEL